MAMVALATKDPFNGEAILARWLKADGERVAHGEAIAELETENASVELGAWNTGTLRHIAKVGDRITVGTVEERFALIEPIEQ